MDDNNIVIPKEFVVLMEQKKMIKRYKAKQLIYREGEKAGEFFYLKRGQVKIFATSDNGAEKTLTIYRDHTFLGEAAFFDGYPRMSSARVLEESEIIAITRQDILEWFRQKPDLAFSMIASLSKTIRMLSGQINQISFLPADKRLAHFLVKETEEGETRISLTHEEIGALIGASRVTVSRIVRDFKQKGWLQTEYGSIHVLKRKSLQEFQQI